MTGAAERSAMERNTVQHHGGDVYSRKVRIDFSVSINPLPLPEEIPAAGRSAMDRIRRYPDPRAAELTEAIAAFEGTAPDNLAIGNGASEIFMAVVHAFRPKRALLVSPCYSGYAYALRAVPECSIRRHSLKEEEGFALTEEFFAELTDDLDILFLASPNNPTGKLIPRGFLEKTAGICEEKGIVFVLDSCFLPLAQQDALPLRLPGVLEVRAFTKMISMPGIRLGYLLSEDPEVIRRVKAQLPEWNLSVPAQEIGVCAAGILAGTDYLERSLAVIAEEKEYLRIRLENAGLEVFESDANFILARGPEGLYEKLLSRGILVRDSRGFEGLGPSFIRIAVRTRQDNEILADEIRRLV